MACCRAPGDADYADCERYAHVSDEQLTHLVAAALLRADPSKAKFVIRFEPDWQRSRPALLRLAHLFGVRADECEPRSRGEARPPGLLPRTRVGTPRRCVPGPATIITWPVV